MNIPIEEPCCFNCVNCGEKICGNRSMTDVCEYFHHYIRDNFDYSKLKEKLNNKEST